MGTPVRLALFCAASALAACGLVASGTATDGGVDVPRDASLDARRDGNGGGDATFDASVDDASDAGADVREASCPAGLPGPTMVKVDEYCIDSTEVTNEQFDQFLTATADAGTPPAPCDWATGALYSYRYYTPWIAGFEKRPAANMNWCGAAEYCRWAKKRLCGKRGGGGNLGASSNDAKDATKSEWFNACSKGGTQGFPYGATYSATACNSGTGVAANVSTYGMCMGGYPGLYDMVGNVIEWQDACETNGNAVDQNCIWQGGSSDYQFNTESERRCNQIDVSNSTERGDRWYDVGFRCCANLQ